MEEPRICGIYSGNEAQNPHQKLAAKSFRSDLFKKLRAVGEMA